MASRSVIRSDTSFRRAGIRDAGRRSCRDLSGRTGLHDAIRAKKSNARIGYIHLDAHFDLGDDNPIYGRLNNATLVRRIMELDGVAPSNISMVGLRGIARKSQVDLTVNSGAVLPYAGDQATRA